VSDAPAVLEPGPRDVSASEEVAPSPIDEQFLAVGSLRVLQRAALALTVQVVGAGLSYGVQVLLARLLGTSHYGVYAYVLVWVTFASLIAGLGFPAASVRFLPVYAVTEDWARLRGFKRTTSKITFATGIAAALCGLAAAEALHISGLLRDPTLVVLGALLVPALAASTLYTEFARAGGRMGSAFVPALIVRPSLIAIGVAGIFVLHGSLSASAALCSTLAVGYVVLVVQYTLTRGLFKSAEPEHGVVVELREWFAVGWPLLAAGAFTITLMQVDIVVVGALRGSQAAGIYAAASKTATLVTFVLLAVNAAAAPQFASLWALGRIDDLQRLLTRMASVIFWPSLAISVGLALLSEPILGLFGPGFHKARWVLLVLLTSQLVNAAAGSVGCLLNVTGHHREASLALGWSALACVVLAIAGAWAFGVIGAALASMLGCALWNGSLSWLVARKLGVQASIFGMLRRPEGVALR